MLRVVYESEFFSYHPVAGGSPIRVKGPLQPGSVLIPLEPGDTNLLASEMICKFALYCDRIIFVLPYYIAGSTFLGRSITLEENTSPDDLIKILDLNTQYISLVRQEKVLFLPRSISLTPTI